MVDAFADSTRRPAPESPKTKVMRVVHTIHAVEDIMACRRLYLDVLGGLIFAEGYFEPEDRDMALLYVADHMIEPMAPRDTANLDKPFARYLRRSGQGFHSFELMVSDARALGASLKSAGCKLASDYGFFFFVRPESTGGILLEVCETLMPNDPYDRPRWRRDWGEGGPSGLIRLDHIACVVANAGAAVDFFTAHTDADVLSDARVTLPSPGRRVLLRIGDTNVAFIQLDDVTGGASGTISAPRSGIFALVWSVEDEARAETFFQAQQLRTTREGCVSPGFAIDPRDFLDARHEFMAAK